MHQLPRTITGRVQLAAAGVLVLLAFAGSAAARIHGAVAAVDEAVVSTGVAHPTGTPAATPKPAPVAADGTFTLGDLAAGRVPRDVQDRFWQAQLDAIRTAPCPAGDGAGGTAVTLFLGADEDWTARLQAASAAHVAACVA